MITQITKMSPHGRGKKDDCGCFFAFGRSRGSVRQHSFEPAGALEQFVAN